jgi:hypothetical protein
MKESACRQATAEGKKKGIYREINNLEEGELCGRITLR